MIYWHPVKLPARARLVRLMAVVGVSMMLAWTPSARANDDERLRLLEEKVQELTRELDALKARRETDDRSASGQSAAPAGVPATSTGSKPAEIGTSGTGRTEAPAARIAQQGIQVRFNEGIFLEDPQGNWSLRVGGRVQLDYRHFSPGGALADTFSVRRARAGVDATLYKDFRIVVEAEYATGNATGTTNQNVALTLGYLDLGVFGPAARVRLGQFKPAFGYEQTLLDLYSDFMERSFAQSLLQNLNYDRGVMVYGTPARGLWYGLTVSNGVGQNLEEKQGNAQEVEASSPDLTARLAGNLAQMLGASDSIVQFGASYKRGEVANSATSPYGAASVQTEARGATFFTPAAFNASGQTAENISREFRAYEVLFAKGSVKLQGEHVEVSYRGSRTSPAPAVDFRRRLKADYIAAMWLITGERYAEFFRDSTIGRIRPRQAFARSADSGWGALELGVRYSDFDGGDFADGNLARTGQLSATAPVSTSASEARAWTFQVKWIPNVYTRIWMNLVQTRFATPIVVNGTTTRHEDAVALRAQIDF